MSGVVGKLLEDLNKQENRGRMMAVCPRCQKEFVPRTSRQVFCSHICAGTWRGWLTNKMPQNDPCFFHWRIPLEEIERLIRERKETSEAIFPA